MIVGAVNFFMNRRALRQQAEALKKTLDHQEKVLALQEKALERTSNQETAALRAEYTKLHTENVLKVYQDVSKQLALFRAYLEGKEPASSLLGVIETFYWAYPFLGQDTINEFDTKIVPLALDPEKLRDLDYPRLQLLLADVLEKVRSDVDAIKRGEPKI
ncbi:MAG: hypothetical protein HY051_02885 [Candidatus Aenigmarchaeota archaeon]|nr:hypothetical protein [Candidatus Aenigmarchaeota archaeon]